MKKKTKASSKNVHLKAMKKDIDAMHKATADFVMQCIDVAKVRPKGLKGIEKDVQRVIKRMLTIDKLFEKMR
jgi:hypothetical protein